MQSSRRNSRKKRPNSTAVNELYRLFHYNKLMLKSKTNWGIALPDRSLQYAKSASAQFQSGAGEYLRTLYIVECFIKYISSVPSRCLLEGVNNIKDGVAAPLGHACEEFVRLASSVSLMPAHPTQAYELDLNEVTADSLRAWAEPSGVGVELNYLQQEFTKVENLCKSVAAGFYRTLPALSSLGLVLGEIASRCAYTIDQLKTYSSDFNRANTGIVSSEIVINKALRILGAVVDSLTEIESMAPIVYVEDIDQINEALTKMVRDLPADPPAASYVDVTTTAPSLAQHHEEAPPNYTPVAASEVPAFVPQLASPVQVSQADAAKITIKVLQLLGPALMWAVNRVHGYSGSLSWSTSAPDTTGRSEIVASKKSRVYAQLNLAFGADASDAHVTIPDAQLLDAVGEWLAQQTPASRAAIENEPALQAIVRAGHGARENFSEYGFDRDNRGSTAKRTDPELWEQVKAIVTAGDKGGRPGQWSARKAQLAVAMYKAHGGGYIGPRDPDNSLTQWTNQKWRTKSGKPSHITGERYLPSAAIEKLSDVEYARTTRAKRAGTRRGQQFVAQPADIAAKVAPFRDNGSSN